MQQSHILWAFVAIAFAIVVWAHWPRPSQPISVSSIPPSFVVAENYFIHCFYRGVELEQFTKTIPDDTLTYLNIDAESNPYVIVIVTCENSIFSTEFETTFTSNSGDSRTFIWPSRTKKLFGKPIGLFVIPQSMTTAKSVRRRTVGSTASGAIVDRAES